MILNRENADVLYTSFNGAFRAGLSTQMAKSQWMRVAMETRSGSSQEQYAWIGDMPALREWVGERVVRGTDQNPVFHLYTCERCRPEARSARGEASMKGRAQARPARYASAGEGG